MQSLQCTEREGFMLLIRDGFIVYLSVGRNCLLQSLTLKYTHPIVDENVKITTNERQRQYRIACL